MNQPNACLCGRVAPAGRWLLPALFALLVAGAGTAYAEVRAEPPGRIPPTDLFPVDGGIADAGSLTFRWAPGSQDTPSRFEVRIDDDGEVELTCDFGFVTDVRATALPWKARLVPGTRQTFAVRAIGPTGPSVWSRPHTFQVIANPPVRIGEDSAADLDDALARARPGDLITLARGIYALAAPLRLPPGINMMGAGPELTALDGRGLDVAVVPGSDSGLFRLRVRGARTGVLARDSSNVRLRNLLVSDSSQGIRVEANASALLINLTIAGNEIGLQALGLVRLRNSLVTDNELGVIAEARPLVRSSYNQIAGNRTADWQTAAPHETDVSLEPRFLADSPAPWLPAAMAPGTDRGDPADDHHLEPEPNGGRVDIGAYGNTTLAPTSVHPDGGGPGLAPPSGEALAAGPRRLARYLPLAAVPLAGLPLALALAFGWPLRWLGRRSRARRGDVAARARAAEDPAPR